MTGHKICFYGELWLIILKLSLLPLTDRHVTQCVKHRPAKMMIRFESGWRRKSFQLQTGFLPSFCCLLVTEIILKKSKSN